MEDLVKEIKEIYEEVKVILIKFQEKMKKYVNRNRKKVVEYKVEDKVLISIKNFLVQLMKRS